MCLARELGMHLHDLMGWPGPMTHRQYGAWKNFLDRDLNRPSRSDHYLMQLTAEVNRGHVKHPDRVKDEDFRIRFTFRPRPGKELTPTPQSLEEASRWSKASWFGLMAASGMEAVRLPPPSSPQKSDGVNGDRN